MIRLPGLRAAMNWEQFKVARAFVAQRIWPSRSVGTSRPNVERIPTLADLAKEVAALRAAQLEQKKVLAEAISNSEDRLRDEFAFRPPKLEETPLAGEHSDAFAKFQTGTAYPAMSKDEIKEDMDRRYETGNAYPDSRLWIETHHRELEATFAELLRGKTAGKTIIELGCGTGGVAPHHVHDAQQIIATDLSDTALQIARDFFAGTPHIQFRQMDSESLQFTERSFDVVIAKEVLEHLQNPASCIAEAHRVLRHGGYFALSSPNRDSLHLRLNRKLGRSDFMCSGDHIREFSYSEMTDMLTAKGFDIADARGVTLMPYHYVEGVFPDGVKALEDQDAEVVDWLRVLGQRAGPEFGFCYVILARKP
jgi:2-polyprenyl-3-methyl-5-hydroxy-6-metoxy-1,4-benzoquinol methylase